jgi:hypothetical protein
MSGWKQAKAKTQIDWRKEWIEIAQMVMVPFPLGREVTAMVLLLDQLYQDRKVAEFLDLKSQLAKVLVPRLSLPTSTASPAAMPGKSPARNSAPAGLTLWDAMPADSSPSK